MLRQDLNLKFPQKWFWHRPGSIIIWFFCEQHGGIRQTYEMPSGYCDGPSCSKPSSLLLQDQYYHLIFTDILNKTENQILSSFNYSNNDLYPDTIQNPNRWYGSSR
jgi:hypothetical protein